MLPSIQNKKGQEGFLLNLNIIRRPNIAITTMS